MTSTIVKPLMIRKVQKSYRPSLVSSENELRKMIGSEKSTALFGNIRNIFGVMRDFVIVGGDFAQ